MSPLQVMLRFQGRVVLLPVTSQPHLLVHGSMVGRRVYRAEGQE